MIKVLKIFVKIKPLINTNFYKPILHIQIGENHFVQAFAYINIETFV